MKPKQARPFQSTQRQSTHRQSIQWLPAERLGQLTVDANLRPWLIGKGLLSVRLKEACGERYALRLVDQWSGLLSSSHKVGLRANDNAGLFREVEMVCGSQVWVFAQTVTPDSTLCLHPWLAELGDTALDETLHSLSGMERSSYEYAWLPVEGAPGGESPTEGPSTEAQGTESLASRALREAEVRPAGLWARRTRIALRGAPLLMQEVFLPRHGPHLGIGIGLPLPRSGVELAERIAERWRWFVYRVRFHPWTTNELPRLLGTIHDYVQLTRLDRPIGIWLLLWPTLWALWIAGRGKPDARLFIIFVVGTVLMRSAGCAINDYADRSFDPHVERTKERPLAAGRISPIEALVLFAALSLTALGLTLQLNGLTLLYAVVGAALAVTYPFVKRFLPVPQLYLGLTFGWGIPMAFAAQLERVPVQIVGLLLLANILWVTVYDTIYAMVDRNDDIKIGVRSTAILFGDSDRHIIATLQVMTLLALYLLGGMLRMGRWYYAGLIAGAIFFVHHLWLIRARDRDACFQAFLNNHYFGLSVFLGIALNYQFGR